MHLIETDVRLGILRVDPTQLCQQFLTAVPCASPDNLVHIIIMSDAGGMPEMPVGPFTPDESSFELWLERSNFVGGELAAVAYGMHALLFGLCVYVMTQRRADLKMYRWSLVYIFALFICGTLNLAFGIKWNQMIWIDNRNFPGGPNAFVGMMFSDPINVASNAAYVTGAILADAFVLWRCFVIWNRNFLVIIFPAFMFLGTVVCGIIALFQASQPGANLWTRVTVNFLIPYFSLSIALNIIVTLMIVGYLLGHRRSIQATIGKQHAKQYTSIIAMVTESAALYSAFSLIFIIAYGRNDPAQNLFLPVLGQVQVR
ncbi:hypothetical protein EXIGLDRAFT_250542 [Exidia glandulosa HHB12029]|uniref:Uncharacterized protein n=1 Tax=Exidia glandulosa HHB12029 TaxID=1314781 RepID=A0A165MHE3_EXIGL|nr:hypothetical protein EXIGLDRAFT_250542 [Exidia glandulosa HHB12029]